MRHRSIKDYVDYAEDLWERPPEGFHEEFESFLRDLDDRRYAPLERTDEGDLRHAERSYSY